MASEGEILQVGEAQETPQAITITIVDPSALGAASLDSSLVDAQDGSDSNNIVMVAEDGHGSKDILQTVTETHMGTEELPIISNICNPEEEEEEVEDEEEEEEEDDETIFHKSRLSESFDGVGEEAELEESYEEAIGPHCLVCNIDLPPSESEADEQILVFKTQTSTTQRRVAIFLSSLIGQKLTSRKAHSDIVCRRCFGLLDRVDSLEVEIRETKEEIVNKYQDTVSIYGGRARRRKPATATKPDYVFPKVEPEDEDDQLLDMELDGNFEPQVEDLMGEDPSINDDDWEPEFKRARIKKESPDITDTGGPPKRKRGRPRKDASRPKVSITVPYEGTGKSPAWKYMEQVSENIVQCVICQKTLKYSNGSTSGMRKHLRMKHTIDFVLARGNISFDSPLQPRSQVSTAMTPTRTRIGPVIQVSTTKPPIRQSKRTKRSLAWKYMEQVSEDIVTCLICEKSFTYCSKTKSTSAMRKHLRIRHTLEFVLARENISSNSPLQPGAQVSTAMKPKRSRKDPELQMSTAMNPKKKKKSQVWNYMEKVSKNSVICLLCQKVLTFSGSTSVMRKHLQVRHHLQFVSVKDNASSDSHPQPGPQLSITVPQMATNIFSQRKRKSAAWKYMEQISKNIIKCLICQQTLTFNSSTSNMRKHLRVRHPLHFSSSDLPLQPGPQVSNAMTPKRTRISPGLRKSITITRKRTKKSLAWKYMEQVSENIVKCLICQRYLTFNSSTSNMRKHLQGMHALKFFSARDNTSSDSLLQLEPQVSNAMPGKRIRKSPAWKHMEQVSENIVKCLICQQTLTFCSSTSNMRKHLQTMHAIKFLSARENTSSDLPPQPEPQVSTALTPKRTRKDPVVQVSTAMTSKVTRKCSVIQVSTATTSKRTRKDPELQKSTAMNPKRTRKSQAWNYMEQVSENNVKCLLCQKVLTYSGSTSVMRKHLKVKHPSEFVLAKDNTSSNSHTGPLGSTAGSVKV